MPTDRRNRVVVMLTNFFLHLHPVSVRKQGIALSYTWCMGGTTFFLFIVEVVTGVLLMFYYRPTLEHAYNDILALRDVTTLGILRELHRWGAHAMVIAVWLHMYRVFLTGSYKPPREFNWVVGVLLLVLTLLLSFTGYLLPWDQLAIWAITVGSNMARATPGVGVEGPGASLLTLNGVSLITSGSDAKFAAPGRPERRRDDPEPVLRAALRGDPAGRRAPDHDPLLARPEGRRDQRPDVTRRRPVGVGVEGPGGCVGPSHGNHDSLHDGWTMHHPDLTPGVMAGLAWYYLLAAMLNAAAAAYVAYMEMVSEGASRAGLAPRTRRLPDWLVVAFLGLYGLATLLILGREFLPQALTVAYGLCALANVMVAIAAGADAAHFAEVKDAGHGRGSEFGGPSLDDHIPAVGLGRPINRTLWTLIWAVVRGHLPGDGARLHPRAGEYALPQFIRDAIDLVSGPTTFFIAATLGFVAMIAYRRTLANGLVAWAGREPLPPVLRPEHDRLRLPRHRHQARQRADRRADRPGRLLHLARASDGPSSTTRGWPRACRTSRSSSPRRPSPGPTWSTPS